ncbi:MAG: hypothetical protein ACOYJZ_07955 [Acutalibacter sp.]
MDDKKPKDYKKPTLLLVALTAAALLVTLFSLSLGGRNAVATAGSPAQKDMSYYTPKASASQESEPSSQPSDEGPYRVAVYQGKIGVFQEGESEPFLTADVEVYLLPKEDIALLRQGILADDLAEVRSILEDYQ